MKFQACTYKTSQDSPRQHGIAKVNCGFGTYDVEWIIDAKTGEKVPAEKTYDYKLNEFPLSYLDTDYAG